MSVIIYMLCKSFIYIYIYKKKKLEDKEVNKESYATSKVQSTLDVLVKSSIATRAEIM